MGQAVLQPELGEALAEQALFVEVVLGEREAGFDLAQALQTRFEGVHDESCAATGRYDDVDDMELERAGFKRLGILRASSA